MLAKNRYQFFSRQMLCFVRKQGRKGMTAAINQGCRVAKTTDECFKLNWIGWRGVQVSNMVSCILVCAQKQFCSLTIAIAGANPQRDSGTHHEPFAELALAWLATSGLC